MDNIISPFYSTSLLFKCHDSSKSVFWCIMIIQINPSALLQIRAPLPPGQCLMGITYIHHIVSVLVVTIQYCGIMRHPAQLIEASLLRCNHSTPSIPHLGSLTLLLDDALPLAGISFDLFPYSMSSFSLEDLRGIQFSGQLT
jgi:hypothetical protein